MKSNQEKTASASSQIELSRLEPNEYETTVCGLSFFCDPEVFSPKYFKSTEINTAGFPFRRGEKLLEIGPGVGVTAVVAALKQDNDVTAIEINSTAVAIAKKNAAKHGVQGKVRILQGDLFSPLSGGQKFDTIYWDFPFVYADQNIAFESDFYRAFFDPGYRQIEEFLREAPTWLKPNGRIIVGFGSNGDRTLFDDLANGLGYSFKEVSRGSIEERGGIFYLLLESRFPKTA
jgi:methylase of polypeptide subunit release factors